MLYSLHSHKACLASFLATVTGCCTRSNTRGEVEVKQRFGRVGKVGSGEASSPRLVSSPCDVSVRCSLVENVMVGESEKDLAGTCRNDGRRDGRPRPCRGN